MQAVPGKVARKDEALLSVHWMAKVWEQGPLDPGERYVLLKLADNADKDGSCFPSMADICRATRLSESSVRRFLNALIKGGWLTAFKGVGRGHNSSYQLHMQKVSGGQVLSEKVSHRKVSTGPIKGVTQTLKGVRLTEPPHPHKGVTVINHQEPSGKLALFPDSANPEIPDWIDPEAWAGFVEMRKKIRNAPFTERAERGILADLGKLKAYGIDPNERLHQAMTRGWRGVLFSDDKPTAAAPKAKSQYELDAERQREERRAAIAAQKVSVQ